jgi:hypothetical protein
MHQVPRTDAYRGDTGVMDVPVERFGTRPGQMWHQVGGLCC